MLPMVKAIPDGSSLVYRYFINGKGKAHDLFGQEDTWKNG
jgi:hypothetical protein